MRALISDTRLAEATRKAMFHERWEREQEAIGSKGGPVSLKRTRLRYHWGTGCQTGRKSLSRPFRNLIDISCENTDLPWTCRRKADMAARCT